jgi:3'-phosphoadenosine 5'-phosphosulfate sulfotransferase (PAPS reductase)/FAD synthetase
LSGANYTIEDLKAMQSWPLERKIQVSQTRIIEWYERHNGAVRCDFSGGKDSTVLLDLIRRIYPKVEAVYCDTGLEFPEARSFALAQENVTVLKPDMNFRQVIDTYGWCFPSKDVAHTLYYARRGSAWALDRLNGVDKGGAPSKYRQSHYVKWAFLLDSPFKISSKCCMVMKERPLDRYHKESGKAAIVGTLAAESQRRKQAWLQTGCNAFNARRPLSKPLSFWTEQDVLRYLRDFKIPYASVYGEIAEDKKGRLSTTGATRTGCVFCPIGAHLGKENRFQRLARTHPKLYDYCIHTLGLGELLDYAGVAYE